MKMIMNNNVKRVTDSCIEILVSSHHSAFT